MSRLSLAIAGALTLMLSGCNEPHMVGQSKIYYDFICVKEESDIEVGINFNGDTIVTPTSRCIASRCMKLRRTLGTIKFLSDEIEKLELADESLCIKMGK